MAPINRNIFREGKNKVLIIRSYFYPIEAKGHWIQTFHDLVSDSFQNLPNTNQIGYSSKNLSQNERRALTSSFKGKKYIVIRILRGRVVIEDYDKEDLNILLADDYYKVIQYDQFPGIQGEFNQMLADVSEGNIIPKKKRNALSSPAITF